MYGNVECGEVYDIYFELLGWLSTCEGCRLWETTSLREHTNRTRHRLHVLGRIMSDTT